MEHRHKHGFCLTCSLTKITPLLPHQGPIKDFIHQNTLQVFIDKPFDEAVVEAASLYGAQSYMDLSFYQNKFKRGEISDDVLLDVIKEQFDISDSPSVETVRHALFNFFEIIDERSFTALVQERKLSSEQVTDALNLARSLDLAVHKNASLRRILNDRVGFAIDHEVNALLFRLLGSYIDQGVSLWPFLNKNSDFKSAVRRLARESFLPIARFVNNDELFHYLTMPTDEATEALLGKMFSSETCFHDYVQESLLHHPGWSGMVNIIAHHPETLAKHRTISIDEMVVVKLAFEWQLIKKSCPDFTPVTLDDIAAATIAENTNNNAILSMANLILSLPQPKRDLSLLNKINLHSLQKTWQIAFEKEYYNAIAAIFLHGNERPPTTSTKKFQAIFCIDDRECSFRRYLEEQSDEIETLSVPGFFGIEYFLKSHKKDILEKMCPAPVTPKFVVVEKTAYEKKPRRKLLEFASFISRHGANSMLVGFLSAYTLGHLSALRLLLGFSHPFMMLQAKQVTKSEQKTSLEFKRTSDQQMHNGLYQGFTHSEMADRVFVALRNMGLVNNFAPVVFAIAHGSSSVNNPHFAAYDCGACSGRPGGINARLFAAMANLKEVRALVSEKGIHIPDETSFVGALHDTCTDDVVFFDLDKLSDQKNTLIKEFTVHLNQALKKNALERCRHFALASPRLSEEKALREVAHRARALFEPRPELCHATNALCIVGRRSRSYKMNFNRRAFLQSYDPTHDDSGAVLTSIMAALVPVCGGINLEYYFSRVDPAVYGCGTKLSHNVCSLVGVGNGLDDDLRTGLPVQMTELHDPIRLLVIIEQTPEIIIKALLSNHELAPWVKNDWMKIAALSPASNELSMINFATRTSSAMGR